MTVHDTNASEKSSMPEPIKMPKREKIHKHFLQIVYFTKPNPAFPNHHASVPAKSPFHELEDGGGEFIISFS
jgi:hypothetical protein